MKNLLLILLALGILSKSMAQDGVVDYEKARFAFAARKNFKPYGLQALEKALIDDAMKAWQSHEEAKAFKIFNELLEVYPYSIETHRRLADGCEIILENVTDPKQKMFFQELEAKHRSACEGIIASIVTSRDGKTDKTAFPVITISEEYMVLWSLKFQIKDRTSDMEKGFDIFTVADEKENERKAYFDISRLINAKGDADEKNNSEAKKAPKGAAKTKAQ